jgi:hypothetical protein
VGKKETVSHKNVVTKETGALRMPCKTLSLTAISTTALLSRFADSLCRCLLNYKAA